MCVKVILPLMILSELKIGIMYVFIYLFIYKKNERFITHVNGSSNKVSVIDGFSNSIIATVSVGTNPSAVRVNPLTNGIYVANENSNTVSVISGNTNTVIST